MINKLPKWVEIGGFLLALNAGYINAIGVLGFKHQAVSHLTGTSTFLSLAIANAELQDIWHLLLVMICFVLGAALSGVLIGHTALKLDWRYSIALAIESLLLLAAMYLLNNGSVMGHLLASAACGLQNAITSTFSGAVVRTTHVSGLFTDLGVAIGLHFRNQAADIRKIVLYLTLIIGFIVGGAVGALVFAKIHFSAMLLPSALTLMLAVSCWVYAQRNKVVEAA